MEQKLEVAIRFLTGWLNTNVLTVSTGVQWACVAGTFLLAAAIWGGLGRRFSQWVAENVSNVLAGAILRALIGLGNVVGFLILVQVCVAVFHSLGESPRVLEAASNLAVAWIIIRLLTSIMPNRALAKGVEVSVWGVAALSVFGLLEPITTFLEGLSFSVGEASFNALGAIKGLAMAALLLQIASLASRFTVHRIETIKGLTPSLRVLMGKAVRVALYTAAILFAMSSVGIDLTSLAIFSSALGVGIGFGLKTIFSNYVAGIILLMDNSIKPGDTIEVGTVYGVVRAMQGRYASVLTRDGKEYLIPNELLISGEVINWTYSDSNVRLKIPVGIAYDSDVEKALELLGESVKSVRRVLKTPTPSPQLSGFGDSSVDLELRVWIADADQGVANVRSEILLNIWKLFHENDIEFPFPQRDVLLKADSKLAVTLDRDGD
ncbi:mechanosensitive ion channel family protein [Pseudodesulfovibrio piezophilus]|uniref:Transporter, small conductance mechanosensitive ion channel (MscS) family protein n=1 Tax=Pseudodesulfovibrio piezophilus (strain DSM 21447 / JCM 15486 / C1TLV30) TaxID=1322246 RepID=M1WQK3_PSEP2|nr:mechanosensitive ion channel domain-containing protein [Pseudodesulfovibrio piezophilus]CCH49014.1 Transporter, small conductance mechanosensitive ion channel (MscS) family protein [Pseudodesulfovibrio piezophilus C1TLV30]